MSNPVRSLRYMKCCSSSSSSNSIRNNCQKICSWPRRPKNILEIRKKENISLGDQQSFYLQVFKDFTNHRKKTNRALVFSCRLFPTFLNIGNTNETFQKSGKQDSFRHILKSSGSMNKSLGSPFLRTITEIWPGREAFDESRLAKPSWKLQTFYAFSEA